MKDNASIFSLVLLQTSWTTIDMIKWFPDNFGQKIMKAYASELFVD